MPAPLTCTYGTSAAAKVALPRFVVVVPHQPFTGTVTCGRGVGAETNRAAETAIAGTTAPVATAAAAAVAEVDIGRNGGGGGSGSGGSDGGDTGAAVVEATAAKYGGFGSD